MLNFAENKINLVNRRISYPINEIIDIAIKNKFPLLDEYKRSILTASME